MNAYNKDEIQFEIFSNFNIDCDNNYFLCFNSSGGDAF